MSPGPLRRVVGVLGLLALVPTALLLTTGTITVEDAAVRGGATLIAALALGRVAGWGLRFLAAEFERSEDLPDAASAGQAAAASPQRRAADHDGRGATRAGAGEQHAATTGRGTP